MGSTYLSKAKQLLLENDATLALVNGDRTFFSHKKGIAPLMELLDKEPELLQGASAADRITGKASALLMILGGVKELSTGVLSRAALPELEQRGIPVVWETLADRIINRQGTGLCPMEETVLHISDPAEAREALRRKMEQLRAGNGPT